MKYLLDSHVLIWVLFQDEKLPSRAYDIINSPDNEIHSHLVFNSVNTMTGEKYHIRTVDYYKQICAVSDRLCREHGLSVVMQGGSRKAVSYIEAIYPEIIHAGRRAHCPPVFSYPRDLAGAAARARARRRAANRVAGGTGASLRHPLDGAQRHDDPRLRRDLCRRADRI